jgi:hypothetical protein
MKGNEPCYGLTPLRPSVMAIKHTPRQLKGKNPRFWISGLAVGLAAFGLMLGAMLTARWIGITSAVILMIVAFISAIVIHRCIRHRLASSLEFTTSCPHCGRCEMHFREEFRDDHAYLVCPDCGTKWDIGQI